ncbi:hypothetical protein [Qipengyuania sp. JC766]|uniref:hypothetical protein n=1 Tax=Qipengyuania sp. JC766 TaxID=3232139 RepID=UPI00345A2564
MSAMPVSENPLDPETLKQKQRELRDGFPLPLTLRVHRALSWLRRAENEKNDLDVRFILLWIGFNAAYAGDLDRALDGEGKAGSERERFDKFFATLVEMDRDNRIYNAIWERFSQEIRLLLDNKFVFAPFWRHQAGEFGGAGWEVSFESARAAANRAVAQRNTPIVLSILFDRLYVLRNQLVHGGATWDSSANRNQVRDGASLLGCLLPVFIDLMMDNPDAEWAMPMYPVVEE